MTQRWVHVLSLCRSSQGPTNIMKMSARAPMTAAQPVGGPAACFQPNGSSNLPSIYGFLLTELVNLLPCLMLVYEFMPKGTLQDWLSGEFEEVLNFSTRLQIALDSTMGILYLHTEADPPIFHRDIKATNILLDSGLNAKVSDFGLSLLAPVLDDEGFMPNHVSTVVKGTPGYLDPEYILTRKLTEKSDVYSLGVVFLEILTGMRAISRGKNIVREVIMAHESGSVLRMMDRRMGSYDSEQAEKFVALALKCCQNKPEERPFVLDVVRELEDILQMMPQARLDSSKLYFSEPLSAPNAPWSMSGSDLSSGTLPPFPR